MNDDRLADPEGWVDRHGDGLYRYALLRLRSPDLAEDVVQDTFLEAIRVRDSFAGRSSERTWLIGILRHKIIDRLRKLSREPTADGAVLPDSANGASFDHLGHWRVGPASWTGDPSREMETRRVLGRLRPVPVPAAEGPRRRLLPPRAGRSRCGGGPANPGYHSGELLETAPPRTHALATMPRNTLVRPGDEAAPHSLKGPSRS